MGGRELISHFATAKPFLRATPEDNNHALRATGQPSCGSKYVSLDLQGVTFYRLYDSRQHLKHCHAGRLMKLQLPCSVLLH